MLSAFLTSTDKNVWRLWRKSYAAIDKTKWSDPSKQLTSVKIKSNKFITNELLPLKTLGDRVSLAAPGEGSYTFSNWGLGMVKCWRQLSEPTALLSLFLTWICQQQKHKHNHEINCNGQTMVYCACLKDQVPRSLLSNIWIGMKIKTLTSNLQWFMPIIYESMLTAPENITCSSSQMLKLGGHSQIWWPQQVSVKNTVSEVRGHVQSWRNTR